VEAGDGGAVDVHDWAVCEQMLEDEKEEKEETRRCRTHRSETAEAIAVK